MGKSESENLSLLNDEWSSSKNPKEEKAVENLIFYMENYP